MGKPSVYPTGVTVYDSSRAWNGFTLFPSYLGATLIDMNGRVVHIWKGMDNAPVKMMPDGQVMGSMGKLPGGAGTASAIDMIQADWDGKVLWHYDHNEQKKNKDGKLVWASRQHHDFQREGSTVGYYTPGSEPFTDHGNTLILARHDVIDPKISDKPLMCERILEVTWDGKQVWKWDAHEHFEEFELSEDARKSLYAQPAHGDWIHLNAVSPLGPNRLFSSGDNRFAPENILCSSRQLNEVFIIEKKTGRICWKIGPDYLKTPELISLGQIIGQHGAHMIPKGLPGEGNILLLDNGSFGGYGKPTGCSPDGVDVDRRHFSRILEFDPVTLKLVWEYSKANRLPEGGFFELGAQQFMTPFIGFVQRLPNGNTLVTEGSDGILREITPGKEIVWEFVNPLIKQGKGPLVLNSSIYRAYRLPYEWAPQAGRPEEADVVPPDLSSFRVPGSSEIGDTVNTSVEIARS